MSKFSRSLKHKNAYHEKRHSLRLSFKGLNCAGDHTWSCFCSELRPDCAQRCGAQRLALNWCRWSTLQCGFISSSSLLGVWSRYSSFLIRIGLAVGSLDCRWISLSTFPNLRITFYTFPSAQSYQFTIGSRSLDLKKSWPILWYQDRAGPGSAPLRSRMHCQWTRRWSLLAIICLHCLPRRASFGKNSTNFGGGNKLNFGTSGFCHFVHDLEVWYLTSNSPPPSAFKTRLGFHMTFARQCWRCCWHLVSSLKDAQSPTKLFQLSSWFFGHITHFWIVSFVVTTHVIFTIWQNVQ